jgi:hypothetical protein
MPNFWNVPGVPHKGWTLINVIDLADAGASYWNGEYETCMMCGKENIRYVHLVDHPHVLDEYRVGCKCAEKMTDDYERPKRLESVLRSRASRRADWANANWQVSKKGNTYLKKNGHILTIFKDKKTNKYKCSIDDAFGTIVHPNITEAKKALFNKMEEMKEKGIW